ncbi:MAG: VanZ family protein [Deltaproteobacteria bacterium]|nr:VanZ family protein [Deltaproteobacteria bacterium]
MSDGQRLWPGKFNHRWILWPPAVVLAVLLFAGGPGYHSLRSVQALWNLGHIVAFSLWTYLLVTWSRVEEYSPLRQRALGIAFCMVAGAGSEWIQSWIGRDASLGDVLRDVAGGWLTLSFFAPSAKSFSRHARRATGALAVFFLVVACLPLATALFDEAASRSRFPVLSDFETPFEKSRWEGGARYSVDTTIARRGKSSLRVDMDTSLYSGVSLVYFPRKWTGYRALVIDVLNPSPDPLDIRCRIHDKRHEEGERQTQDRFNRFYRLPPGWNEIRIDLDDVANAPKDRAMDLENIRAVGLFAMKLPAPRSMYVDSVRLE